MAFHLHSRNILKCPCCGYPLQKRSNNNFNITGQVWVCSNDPKICGFVTNDISSGKLCISKCPKCEDGYLIVKTIKMPNGNDQKMLGCSNYKADGIGCSTYLMSHNYTQDLEEFEVRFYDENTDINKVKFCGHNFKKLVNSIIEVVNSYKNPKLSIGPRLLFSILAGKTSKAVELFKMYNNSKFGYLSEEYNRKFYRLLNALKDGGIINVDENDFSRITVIKDKLDENDYKIIYASIKL